MSVVRIPGRGGRAALTSALKQIYYSVSGASPVLRHGGRRGLHRPASRPSGGKTHRPGNIFAIWIVLAIVGGVMAIALTRSSSTPTSPAFRTQSGTIASVRTLGNGQLLVRNLEGSVVAIPTKGKELVSRDGSPLAIGDLRPADRIIAHGERVVDMTQSRAQLSGIIALAPDLRSDAITVQITSDRVILVNLGPKTRINGRPNDMTVRMFLMQSQPVRIVGVLDTALDEMTQTWSIEAKAA